MIGIGIGLILYGIISFIIEASSGESEEFMALYAALYFIVVIIGIICIIVGAFKRGSKKNPERKSTFTCKIDNPVEFQNNANKFLSKKKYALSKKGKNKDEAWTKRCFLAPFYSYYITVKCSNGTARISGWIIGPFDEQMALEGFSGGLYKLLARSTIKKIMKYGKKD
jgi:hypothetical protein